MRLREIERIRKQLKEIESIRKLLKRRACRNVFEALVFLCVDYDKYVKTRLINLGRKVNVWEWIWVTQFKRRVRYNFSETCWGFFWFFGVADCSECGENGYCGCNEWSVVSVRDVEDMLSRQRSGVHISLEAMVSSFKVYDMLLLIWINVAGSWLGRAKCWIVVLFGWN